ncbi:MAG: hypothetical protein Q7N50_11005 [Armatimonadota bacterium]|nr:hypothetical protein [Armatimonadota bacterium]
MDLVKIAERLDAEEKLKLKYRRFVSKGDEQTQAVRMDKLLDVEPEQGLLFVSFDDRDIIWVRVEEAIEALPDDGVYGEAAGH